MDRVQDPDSGSPQNRGYAGSAGFNHSNFDGFSPRTGQEGSAFHFEIPNLSSMLYEFTNKEKEVVEKWWRVGNYYSLRDLPTHIHPSHVLKSYQEKQDIAHLPVKRNKMTSLSDGGYFSRFEYQAESYDDYLSKAKTERDEHKSKIQSLHGSSKFMAGKTIKPLKYEGQFGPADEHVYPFFVESDPFEGTIEEVLKNKWMEESKKLHGEFVAFSKDKLISKTNRNALGDMVAFIK